MSYKGQKKVSISMESPTIITRPSPIANPSKLVYVAAFAALTGAIGLGLVIGYSSPAVIQMQTYIEYPRKDPNDKESEVFLEKDDLTSESWISSIITLGSLTGSLLAGTIASAIGKKNALCFYGIPFAASWLTIALAPNIPLLLIGRFFTGFFGGIISGTAPSYVCEISTPSVRGTLGSGFQLLVTIGILISSCLGSFIYWRWSAALFAIPSVLQTVLMYFMPESPTHTIFNKEISQKTIAKARLALERFRTDDSTINDELDQLLQTKAQLPSTSQSFMKKLRHSDFNRPLVFSLALMLVQQFSGINAVVFYIHENFKSALPDFNLDLAAFLVFFAQSLATFIESLIVDRFGRRLLLVVSGCGVAVNSGLIGLFYLMKEHVPDTASQYSLLPLFSLVMFIIFFSIGFAPIPWMMIPEMTPVESRGIISTLATAVNWGSAFFITLTFPLLKDQFGPGIVYIGFFVITVFGTIFLLVCLPETSGKTLNELRSHYATGWKNSLFSASVPRRLSTNVAASTLNLPVNDQFRTTTSM